MAIEETIHRAEADPSSLHADRAASDLAARQHGVLSARELHRCGIDSDAIGVRVGNARLHPLHFGVYAVGYAVVTLEGCFLAAVKACGEAAVLCGRSAAVLHGILEWEAMFPDVLVLGARAPRHERIRGHRTNYLPREHVTTVRGIAVTTAERTLLDLADVLSERALRRAVRQAQYLRLTSVGSLVAALHGPGPRRGRKKLARIVGTEAAPTQSQLEDVVLELVLSGGFVHPVVNEPLLIDGRRIVPDLRWPRERLIIEADGPHHEDPFERAADRERQRVLEAHGYRVIRITWAQAVMRPAETLRRIAAAGAPRRDDRSG